MKSQDDNGLPQLDVNPETICRLIQLAREFHAQESVVIPDEPANPMDDWPTQILASHRDDATFAEFTSFIQDLDRDQQVQAVGLLWLGRDDYALDEWDHLLIDADQQWTDYTADYLIAHPMLAYYLGEGLDRLGYRCE